MTTGQTPPPGPPPDPRGGARPWLKWLPWVLLAVVAIAGIVVGINRQSEVDDLQSENEQLQAQLQGTATELRGTELLGRRAVTVLLRRAATAEQAALGLARGAQQQQVGVEYLNTRLGAAQSTIASLQREVASGNAGAAQLEASAQRAGRQLSNLSDDFSRLAGCQRGIGQASLASGSFAIAIASLESAASASEAGDDATAEQELAEASGALDEAEQQWAIAQSSLSACHG